MALRYAARKLRKEREGEPEFKTINYYKRLDIDKLRTRLAEDLYSGQLREGTRFYRRLQDLVVRKQAEEKTAKSVKKATKTLRSAESDSS